MARKQQHREPIIDAAVALFRRQGYTGTGLNDIVDASGAPKGSLYHYFPNGKVSIAVAAVEEAGERVVKTLQEVSESTATTADLVIAHADLLAGWMQKSGYRDGCPITTVLLELAPQERAVTEAGRKAYAARIDILCQKLESDGVPRKSAAGLAQLCTSAIQGALIQARLERSKAPITNTARELAELIRVTR